MRRVLIVFGTGFCALPLFAIETLVIGSGGLPWTVVVDSTGKVSVAADSIWTWPVAPRQNIAREVFAHGGQAFAVVVGHGAFGQTTRRLSVPIGIEKILDGNADTAFNPDDAEVAAQRIVKLDLRHLVVYHGDNPFLCVDGHVGYIVVEADHGVL